MDDPGRIMDVCRERAIGEHKNKQSNLVGFTIHNLQLK